MGKPIFVDVEPIAVIIGLPLAGMDPKPLLRKDQEATIATQMKDKYDITRDKRGCMIASINDYIVLFAAKILDSKLLCMMHPNQCTAGVIALVELCAKGVQINWS